MAKRKTILIYAAFYGTLILVLGTFVALKYGHFIGNLSPGESKVFQASVFVNRLSDENKVFLAESGTDPPKWRPMDATDPVQIKVENIQNYGFFLEYARQPRCTFDYRVAASDTAKPGRYTFRIVFDSGYEYFDSVVVTRKLL
ncbi:hypothetical protein KDL45_13155 [bacterium]|nr:hypothetical protein [bacterium]